MSDIELQPISEDEVANNTNLSSQSRPSNITLNHTNGVVGQKGFKSGKVSPSPTSGMKCMSNLTSQSAWVKAQERFAAQHRGGREQRENQGTIDQLNILGPTPFCGMQKVGMLVCQHVSWLYVNSFFYKFKRLLLHTTSVGSGVVVSSLTLVLQVWHHVLLVQLFVFTLLTQV